jgi:hypothetical protein
VSRTQGSRRIVLALAACSTAALSLAGCGGSSKASASTQTGGSSSGSAKSATKTGSGGSGGQVKGAVNVCELMPAATLSQLTGKQFTSAEPDNTPSYKLYSCNYTSTVAQGANQLDLDVEGENGAIALSADVDAAKSVNNNLTNLTPVSGIGDKAYGGGIQGHLEVLYGDVLIKISGVTDVSTDQGKQIIGQLHSKL